MNSKEVISTFPIVLNSTNLDSAYPSNNVYTYRFPSPANFKNSQIAVQAVNIFFSWYNITSLQGNNTFQYIWTDGSGSTTTTVTLPDGYYSISDINSYLESVMIGLGQYLVDASGNYVYYLQATTNAAYYAVEFDMYAFPTALPAGWSNPNTLLFPATASTTQVIIQANNFSDVVGILPGTYPAVIQATTYSTLSTFTPQVDYIESVILTCNLLNNKLSIPNNIISTFTSGATSFGGLIAYSPNEIYFINISDGQYANISVEFRDQFFNALPIRDNNITITLLLRVSDNVRL